MTLFKILQEFLVPSVFILVLFLIGIILVFRKRKQKTGKILIILGIIFYYLFSITPVADLIISPLENQYQPIQKGEMAKSDKIVLLLGGKESDFLRASEIIRIYNQQLAISNQQLTIIISGRDPLNPENREGKEVKEFLAGQGVPAGNIILEDKSRTTKESAQNLKEVVGSSSFFLVTSAYHMKRSIVTFKKFGLNPIPAPTDFKRKGKLAPYRNEVSGSGYDILDFFPDAKNLKNSDRVFHEYLGILFYKFF